MRKVYNLFDMYDLTNPLARDIAAFINDENAGGFEALILRLFARQYEFNDAFRAFCDSLGITPATCLSWMDIPAVPARAFKIATLSCAPLDEIVRTFHSSGTTEGQTSKNYLDQTGLDLYSISLTNGFRRVAPAHLPILALMPPPEKAPNSSLSYMLGDLGAKEFFWGDHGSLRHRLKRASMEGEPICVFGTAFALLELFDELTEQIVLPSGSIVIETGGFKGRTRQVSREELYALIAMRLGVAPPHAFAEYGMSEMASQYYGTPASGFTGSHWMRARIIDPLTEQDADEGVLRHYDLANWNSVCIIQTQDTARRLENGAFELLGRASGAELRGCSLSVEERWAQSRQP